MGDMGDYIDSTDTRRYDITTIDNVINTPAKQFDYLCKVLKPIKSKIYGILRGNHEAVYAKTNQDFFHSIGVRDYAEALAEDLEINYFEELSFVELFVKKHKYKIVVAHGSSASSTLSGQIKALQNIINSFEYVPDLVAQGHVHVLQTLVNPKMNFNFKTKIKHLALTGNYYKTYNVGEMNYASSSLFNPLPVGCVKYNLDNKGNMIDEKIIFE